MKTRPGSFDRIGSEGLFCNMLLTIDSSVYLSALVPSEYRHAVSQQFLAEVERTQSDVVLPAIIPLEIVNTLRRRGLTRAKAIDLLDRLYHTDGMRIVAVDRAFSAQLLTQRARLQLKTADWIIAGTCRHYRSQLITWDEQLLRRTKRLARTVMPEVWLAAR